MTSHFTPWRRLSLILAGLAILAGPALGQREDEPPRLETLRQLEESFESLYQEVAPSVVGITASGRSGGPLGLGGSTELEGSGVIVSTKGHVLTTIDVIPDVAEGIRVTLYGKEILEATEVARDIPANVVLLQLPEGRTYPAVPLARTAGVHPGQMVMSLGNTYGSLLRDGQPAFSVGVVTQVYRMQGEGSYRGTVIETDAAVNPGTFGGALVNAEGQLIGLLSESFTTSGWLGTAVPVDVVQVAYEGLKEGRQPEPGYLGVTLANSGGGTVVRSVTPDSPAARAGIQVGDVIQRFDGRQIRSWREVADSLALVPVGTPIPVLVDRSGQQAELVVRSAVRPDEVVLGEEQVPGAERLDPPTSDRPYLGVSHRTDQEKGGAIIEKVQPESPAEQAGLRPGDVVVGWGKARVEHAQHLTDLIDGSQPGDQVMLWYRRDGDRVQAVRIELIPYPETAEAPQPDAPPTHPDPPPTRPSTAPGFLGVRVVEADGAIRIEAVVPGSVAEAAGLQANDAILWARLPQRDALRPIPSPGALIQYLRQSAAGDALELRVERDGWERTFVIELAARPTAPDSPPAPRVEPQPRPDRPTGRPFLGASLAPADAGGLVVQQLVPDGPAAGAGLKVGDRLLVINDQAAPLTTERLRAILSEARPGDTLRVQAARGDAMLRFSIVLGQWPDRLPRTPQPQPDQGAPVLGITLAEIESGFEVTSIQPDGLAQQAGLRKGDRVTSVSFLRREGGTMALAGPGLTLQRFARAFNSCRPGDIVTFSITRQEKALQIEVPLVAASARTRPTPEPAPAGPGYIGFYVEERATGLVITQVNPGGPAEMAGLKPGDIILAAGLGDGLQQRIEALDELGALLRGSRAGQQLNLQVRRNAATPSEEVLVVTAMLSARPSDVPGPQGDK